MRQFIKDWGSLIVEISAAAISIYLDHTERLSEAFGVLYPVVQPVLFTIIGGFIGFNLSKRIHRKQVAELESSHEGEASVRADAHAAEIDKLKAEHARKLEEEDRRLCEQMATMNREVDALRTSHRSELQEKDKKIEKLKAELKEAKAKLPKRIERPKPSVDAIMSLNIHYAAGVLDALRRHDAGERFIKFGDNVEASLKLIENSNGIIERHRTIFMGMVSMRDEYSITPEWMAFLSDPVNRKALESMGSNTKWPI